MKKIISLSFIILLASACQSSKLPGTKAQQETYNKLAQERLGENVEYASNKDKTLVLCTVKAKVANRLPTELKFLVYNLNSSEVAMEMSVGNGAVSWFSNNQIEVYDQPGVMIEGKSKDDYTTIYNVLTGEKIKKTDL